jgi:hypothetical protein
MTISFRPTDNGEKAEVMKLEYIDVCDEIILLLQFNRIFLTLRLT